MTPRRDDVIATAVGMDMQDQFRRGYEGTVPEDSELSETGRTREARNQLMMKPTRHEEQSYDSYERRASITADDIEGIKKTLDALLPRKLPASVGPGDNAIQQVTLALYGRPDIGKSNGARWIVEIVCQRFGKENVDVQVAQAENFGILLEHSHWANQPVQVKVLENLTFAEIRDRDLRDFFRIRELMERNTGRREGICIVIFTCHRFPNSVKSLRSNCDALIALSTPWDEDDRDILERKIGKENVDYLEMNEAEIDALERPAFITFRGMKPVLVTIPKIDPQNSFMVQKENEWKRRQTPERTPERTLERTPVISSRPALRPRQESAWTRYRCVKVTAGIADSRVTL